MSIDFHWQVQEAKQRFSEVLRAAERGQAQYVTRHGKEVAVVISIEDFDRMAKREATGRKYKDFNDWLLSGPRIPEKYADVFERQPEPQSSRETPFEGIEWE